MTDDEIRQAAKRAGGKRIPFLIFPDQAIFLRARDLRILPGGSADYETSNTKTRATAVRAQALGVQTFEMVVDEEVLQNLLGP